VRSNFKINCSKMCIRNDQGLKFEDLDTDVKEKFGEKYQQLFTVHKIRNKYFIEGMKPLNPKDDIDEFYLEAGEPTLPAVEMRERMYNVIRFIQFKNEEGVQDFVLKKNDIIKMGRVKIKIKHIHKKGKVELRAIRQKRRIERLEIEKLNNKKEEVKEGVSLSKYPEGYQNVPLGSDFSHYLPIVGEINYVEAVVPVVPEPIPEPVKPAEVDIEKDKKSSELIDIIPPNAAAKP